MADRIEPYAGFDPQVRAALDWLNGKAPVMKKPDAQAATERVLRIQEVIAFTRLAEAVEKLAEALLALEVALPRPSAHTPAEESGP